jgi:hypothetical protein
MENVTLFNKEEIKGLYQVSKTIDIIFFSSTYNHRTYESLILSQVHLVHE